MSYTTIDNPELYFQTKLYAGNNGTQSITLDGSENMRPDWVWIKPRNGSDGHVLIDSVRGVLKRIRSEGTNVEDTLSNSLTSFDNDGFTLGNSGEVNSSSYNLVSWNWSAGGASPSITYSVKVVSDSGNKYRFDDFGTSAVTLDLQEGGTYTFDQSDSSNSGHPLRFSTTSNGTHGGGSEYTTGVTVTGTPGSSGAKTVITVAASAPTLYYYCTQHSAMGGQANTNSTFGSSNFGGSIQSKVSASTDAGFSIVSYTGTGSNATIGHGLSSVPKVIICKNRDTVENWITYHEPLGAGKFLRLNQTNAETTSSNFWNDTTPTSSVFSVATGITVNNSGDDIVAYCFAEKKGYSKFGSYVGNGSTDGSTIWTGMRISFLMVKASSDTSAWYIYDNKRVGYNPDNNQLYPDRNNAEDTTDQVDFLSNGFKWRTTGDPNTSGRTYIYMAFAESPFVTSTGIPTTAR